MNEKDVTIEELTQNRVDEVGVYRAAPVAWTIIQSTKSESVGIKIQWSIRSRWYPDFGEEGGWSEDYPIGYFSESTSWVIGRDGQPNERTVKALAEAGVWSGDFDALSGSPPDLVCHVEIQPESDPRYTAVQWINPDAEVPRKGGSKGLAPVNADALKALRAKFGSGTKAIASSVGKAAGAPAASAGAPAAPKPAAARPPAPGAPKPGAQQISEEETPF